MKMRIIHKGKLLEEGKSIDHYGIKDKSGDVQMVLGMKGG